MMIDKTELELAHDRRQEQYPEMFSDTEAAKEYAAQTGKAFTEYHGTSLELYRLHKRLEALEGK